MNYRLSAPCRGSNTFDAIPQGEIDMTPEKMKSILVKAGYEIKVNSDVIVIGKKGEIELALYRRGKLIIKNVTEKESADKIAKLIFDMMK